MTHIRSRTRADQLGDAVSLAVLLMLGGFAISVSYSHTSEFIRTHGQHQPWIIYGTAATVVGLTVQSGMEVWRDRRDGRRTGWPAGLLGVGVLVELTANASTAHGITNQVVAAWPVPVAAAALHIWTRRLAAYATAEDESTARQYSTGAGADVVELAAADVVWASSTPTEPPVNLQSGWTAAATPDVVDLAELGDQVDGQTVMARGVALLESYPDLTADQIATALRCSDRYGRKIRQAADERSSTVPEQIPGQMDFMTTTAA